VTAGFRFTAALALAAALSVPAGARTWKQVFPLQQQKVSTIASEGVTVTLTPPPPAPEDREVSDEEYDALYKDPTIVVTFPGLPPFEVPQDASRSSVYGISVGIGRMSRDDPAPTVLISGYSGGMHCCATLQIVSLVGGAPVVDRLPPMDGEPLDRFPSDIDGDGTRDIRWNDDSLLYQFASHAGSRQVPSIYAIKDGHAVDVSREARFASVYRRFARDTLTSCRRETHGENGECAAYAYAMALQGQAEQGIQTAAALVKTTTWLPSECTVALVEDQCPKGKERTFEAFEPALRWIMQKHGYLP
jgi:hypothetical protein